MTDRELLEAAAMAAGHETSRWVVQPHGDREGLQFPGAMGVWNPLTDDGDALRLAVKLGLTVTQFLMAREAAVNLPYSDEEIASVHYGDDPAAATRRAIVRAAAEIGRKS